MKELWNAMLEMQIILILNGNDNVTNLSKSPLKFCLFLKVLINWGWPQLCFFEEQIVIISLISFELWKNRKKHFPRTNMYKNKSKQSK